jgi:hypothetical protein
MTDSGEMERPQAYDANLKLIDKKESTEVLNHFSINVGYKGEWTYNHY